jgi:hypothetical protein
MAARKGRKFRKAMERTNEREDRDVGKCRNTKP